MIGDYQPGDRVMVQGGYGAGTVTATSSHSVVRVRLDVGRERWVWLNQVSRLPEPAKDHPGTAYLAAIDQVRAERDEARADLAVRTQERDEARGCAERAERTLAESRWTLDEGHCGRCGCYMPKTLAGTTRIHDCNRTPPSDGLPPTIYACPVCAGHGLSRWGCWGTRENPHEHAYMGPVHEIVAECSDLREKLEEAREILERLTGFDQSIGWQQAFGDARRLLNGDS